MSERIFLINEDDEFLKTMDKFKQDRFTLFEKRKLKAMEQFFNGAIDHLSLMIELEEVEVVVAVKKQLQQILERLTAENKGIKLHNFYTQFKETGEKMLQAFFSLRFLVKV